MTGYEQVGSEQKFSKNEVTCHMCSTSGVIREMQIIKLVVSIHITQHRKNCNNTPYKIKYW